MTTVRKIINCLAPVVYVAAWVCVGVFIGIDCVICLATILAVIALGVAICYIIDENVLKWDEPLKEAVIATLAIFFLIFFYPCIIVWTWN